MTYSVNDKALLSELPDGTGLLLHLDTKFYYTLNDTGVCVWKHIQRAPCKLEDVVAAVVRRFEVDASAARPDVERVLHELVHENLLSVDHSC